MSIDIKKTGKNTYYRKDGNKMGGRKEKQEVLNISIKHWERDMAVRHRAGAKTMTGWGQFEGMMAGGFKRGEMAMVGAICDAFPEDHFKSNVALAAVRAVDRNNVVMIGMEHEFDHTDRLAEELKVHGKYMPYNRPIQLAYVNGVPYNPMDEFDRPGFYKEKQFIVDMPDSIYPKNPEEVLSEQFKIDVNDTHQKLVIDTINNFVNVNKPYKLVVDNEGRQLYPETNMGLEDVNLKTSLDKVPETHVDENVWYMQKSKITLVIPDWMIEPKDVYEYMNSTGISEEEKEDTLSKRLDKLLEGTYYKYNIEEKMVPDTERTMLYTIILICGAFVTCVNELDNKTYYTKLEALAEAYKAIHNFKKEGYLKFNKDDENVLKPLDDDLKYDSSLPLGVTSLEDLSNWAKSSGFKFEYTKPEILNIGRGFSKPVHIMDVSLEDLLAMIINLLPVNSYPSIISLENKKYVACVVDDNGNVISKESEEYDTASEAFSMLYTRLIMKVKND